MNLVDHRGRPLRVLETPGDPRRLAVFYPGLGYGPLAPLFFCLDKILADAGWSVLAIDYRYNENSEYQASSEAEKAAWLTADAALIARWVKTRAAGAQVAYVAKSLGTTVLLRQLQAGLITPEATLVWLTPGTTASEQFALVPQLSQRSLVAYGTADPHILSAQGGLALDLPRVTVVEVEGAGHIFEVPGDLRRSLMNVADVVEAVAAFLSPQGPA